MPLIVEISKEQAAANLIRTALRTLDSYRRTSMRLHNRPVPSVIEYAKAQQKSVDDLLSEYPYSDVVVRWYRKFDEYVEQYKLV